MNKNTNRKYPKRKNVDQVNKDINKSNKDIENKYKKLFDIIGYK